MVEDRVKNCDKLLLQLYKHFEASPAYISGVGKPAPAHIYARYDNAFRRLKSKAIKDELTELVSNPRNAFYLPLTIRMLASWKIPRIKDLLIQHLSGIGMSASDVGLKGNGEAYFPPLSGIKRELRFTALAGLKYYPSSETVQLLQHYTLDENPNVSAAAQKSLAYIRKRERE